MSAAPLPQRVNIRKAVTRGAKYAGRLGAAQLPQFASLLDPVKPDIGLQAEFGEDEEGQQYIVVAMQATVVQECQRCLQPVLLELAGESRLGLVPGDEQARHLPPRYEPWLAVDEVDLWELAGEELALALPVVAYHPEGDCSPPGDVEMNSAVTGLPEDKQQALTGGSRDNPFSVLSTLLDSGDAKEK
jgi:uncharacterized protein